ncbi:MAG: sigma-54-dependent Fis family transcriptional regulator [Kiritimatiellae bacterium]|nr:sigma-54-dependent Fis family transcriptional regulator [Kiritimatiellia bacterium]
MRSSHLTSSEREFLELISITAFANPFSDTRSERYLKISGAPKNAPPHEIFQTVSTKVHAFMNDILKAGKANIQNLSGKDRQTMTNAHLFDIFHQFMPKMDQLIEKQIKTRDASCSAPFAPQVLSAMKERGLTAKDALRYFAMFYQLRRAYYFIDCSLVGRADSMKHFRLSLWNNVFTHDMHLYNEHLWNRMEDFSTLLLGETGTGKGAAATAIGRSGFIPFDDKNNCFEESFTRSFIPINLSQFPESLIESELFGHKKGSFTGAIEAHEGVFSRCSPHGAIFLDEIGDVSIPVQIKLLQVLQERSFSPVGSHESRRFHGRVIAASNRSIDKLRHKNLFRHDFFYRLCSDVITVPPLRQRISEEPMELEDLTSVTISRILGDSASEQHANLTQMVIKIINRDLKQDYAWPGNVRELEQCIRKILLTNNCKENSKPVTTDLRSTIAGNIDSGTYRAQDLLIDYCRLLYNRHGTYEEVARRTDLDRRTVRKYVVQQ